MNKFAHIAIICGFINSNYVFASDDYDRDLQRLMSAAVNNSSKILHAKFEQGRPALHAEIQDRKYHHKLTNNLLSVDCIGQRHLCSDRGEPIILN
jgi:hypothetical protein